MADQTTPNTPPSDEIDFGQLLQVLGNGLKKLGNIILYTFIYFKKNAKKLIALIVIGVGISFVLNTLVSKKLKTDVIVRPNFESKQYVYDVIDEIQTNVTTRDTAFFKKLDISIEDLRGFKVQIETIGNVEEEKEKVKEDLKYLELLQHFKQENFVVDIVRSELSRKSIINDRITFLYKNAKTGTVVVEKLLKYINANPYFDGLKKTYRENAQFRIERNQVLIKQIDDLVTDYSKGLLKEDRKLGEGTVFMENESSLNVPSLLLLKNNLTKEIEEGKLELATQNEVLSLINVGKTQEVKKPFFNQWVIAIPTYLIIGFFIFSFLQFLNRKSQEIQ